MMHEPYSLVEEIRSPLPLRREWIGSAAAVYQAAIIVAERALRNRPVITNPYVTTDLLDAKFPTWHSSPWTQEDIQQGRNKGPYKVECQPPKK